MAVNRLLLGVRQKRTNAMAMERAADSLSTRKVVRGPMMLTTFASWQ